MKGNAVASTVPMYPTAPDYPTSYANSIGYDMERCQRILDNFGIRDYDEDGRVFSMDTPEVDFSVFEDRLYNVIVVRA